MHWKDGAKFFLLSDNEIQKNNLWNEEDVYFFNLSQVKCM